MFALCANKVNLKKLAGETLTAGASGIYTCQFDLSEDWAGLSVKAVFRAGDVEKNALLTEGVCEIPWEVLVTPGMDLYAGLYGIDGQGLRQCSVWTWLGRVEPGATLGEDILPSTPSLAEQVLQEIHTSREEAQKARDVAVSAALHPPYPSTETQTWWQWDPEKEAYFDTGLTAVGTIRTVEGVLPDETGNVDLPEYGASDALVTLAELGIVTPAQQDGVVYTDNDGKVFVL